MYMQCQILFLFFLSLRYYFYNIHKRLRCKPRFLFFPSFLSTNSTLNHCLTAHVYGFFYCSQISFENANNAKDKKMRRASSHKFPQRITYLSTKIKALREKYLCSCWGYLIDTITLQANISIMTRGNRRQFYRKGDMHRGVMDRKLVRLASATANRPR